MRNLARTLQLLCSLKGPEIGAIFLALCACSPKILPPPDTTSSSDSVQIEIHEYFIHDSIPYEVPVIIEKNMTRDTTSHLENDWAESDAALVDGFLSHSLETKGRTVYIPVQVPVHDTVIVEKSAEKEVIEVEVEKSLSWWQRLRIEAFLWLLAGLFACLLWIFRKPLLKLFV